MRVTCSMAAEFVAQMRSLLKAGDFDAAVKLSFEAMAKYFDHEVIQKLVKCYIMY